jgi:hypothetical protein
MGIFANDPDHACFRFRLVQGIQVFAQGRNDRFVTVGVFAENILLVSLNQRKTHLDDNNGLLDDIVDFVFDQIQQGRNAALGRRSNLYAATTNGLNRLTDEINVNFIRISLTMRDTMRCARTL